MGRNLHLNSFACLFGGGPKLVSRRQLGSQCVLCAPTKSRGWLAGGRASERTNEHVRPLHKATHCTFFFSLLLPLLPSRCLSPVSGPASTQIRAPPSSPPSPPPPALPPLDTLALLATGKLKRNWHARRARARSGKTCAHESRQAHKVSLSPARSLGPAAMASFVCVCLCLCVF